MFRSAILLSLTTLALGLSTGDLTVTVNAVSAKVSSIEDIILTAVVSNPTDSDIRVIKLANVLDESSSESFKVSKDGKDVDFTGIYVSPFALLSLSSRNGLLIVCAGPRGLYERPKLHHHPRRPIRRRQPHRLQALQLRVPRNRNIHIRPLVHLPKRRRPTRAPSLRRPRINRSDIRRRPAPSHRHRQY